jgi:hypothetical protein
MQPHTDRDFRKSLPIFFPSSTVEHVRTFVSVLKQALLSTLAKDRKVFIGGVQTFYSRFVAIHVYFAALNIALSFPYLRISHCRVDH